MELPALTSVSFFLGFELKSTLLFGVIYISSISLMFYSFFARQPRHTLSAHYLFKLAVIIHGLAVLIRIVFLKKYFAATPYETLLFSSFLIALVYLGFRKLWADIHVITPFVALIGASNAIALIFNETSKFNPNPYTGITGGEGAIPVINFFCTCLAFAGVTTGALFALSALLFGYSPLKKALGPFALNERDINRCFYECARTSSFAIPLFVFAIIGDGFQRVNTGRSFIPTSTADIAVIAAWLVASGAMYMYQVRFLRRFVIIPWMVMAIIPTLVFIFALELSSNFNFLLIPFGIVALAAILISYFHPKSQRALLKPRPVEPDALVADTLTVGIEHKDGLKKFLMAAKGLGYKFHTKSAEDDEVATGFLTRGTPAIPASIIFHISALLLAVFVLLNLTKEPEHFTLDKPLSETLKERIEKIELRGIKTDYYNLPVLDFSEGTIERFQKVFSFSAEELGFKTGGVTYRTVRRLEFSAKRQGDDDEVRFKISSGKGLQLFGGILTVADAWTAPLFTYKGSGILFEPPHFAKTGGDCHVFKIPDCNQKVYTGEFRQGNLFDAEHGEKRLEGEVAIFSDILKTQPDTLLKVNGKNEFHPPPCKISSLKEGRSHAKLVYTPMILGTLLIILSIIALASIAIRVFGRWHRIYFVLRDEKLYFNIETAGFFVDKKVIAEYLITALI